MRPQGLFAALALLSGCAGQLDSPTPSLSSLNPALVCGEQLVTSLEVNGAGLSPMTVDVTTDHPSLRIPALHLARQSGLDGAAVSDAPIDLDASPQAAVQWYSQSRMGFSVTPDMALPEGLYQLSAANADGQLATLSQALTVAPRPVLETVAPLLFCVDEGPTLLTLTGAGFLSIEGQLPTVTIGGLALPADQVGDCTPLPGPTPAETCASLTVTLPANALPSGQHEVVVTNPEPAACSSSEALALEVVPPPAVDALSPPQLCSEAADTTVSLEGAGFLVLAGSYPVVSIGGVALTVQSASSCTELAGGGQSCASIQVLIPKGTFTQPGELPVTVTNPEPAACSSQEAPPLLIVSPPVIVGIEPAQVCTSGGSFVIKGSGFAPGARVLIGDQPASAVVVENEGSIRVTAAPDLSAGTLSLTVTNPDGCSVVRDAALQVTAGPLLYYVDPPVVYAGITLQASLYVSGIQNGIDGVWIEEAATGLITALEFTFNPSQPNLIQALVPAGLPRGAYDVYIEDDTSCTPFLEGGLFVESVLSIAIDALQPSFAWTEASTAVDILAIDPVPEGFGQFQDLPRVYLTPHDPTADAVATHLRSLAFDTPERLSAVVPAGLEPGAYDVVVVNPDGSIGVLDQGLNVTGQPPPVITSASPTRVSASSTTAVTLLGESFRTPEVLLNCVVPGGLTQTLALRTDSSSASSITVSVPGGTFPEGSVCVVRVIDDDGSYFDFSAISVGSPSGNLFGFTPGPSLNVARRAPALVAGRSTATARYLYAIGGDDGKSANALDSIEVAAVDSYGTLGAWQLLPTGLPAKRTLAGVARLDRFLYLVGGNGGLGAVNTVMRAQVLDPQATPGLESISIELDDETGLEGGAWGYRIAALFGAGDSINPGGESLADDPIAVQLPDLPGRIRLTLSWKQVARATGYRIYRTPFPDAGSGSEEWLADVAGGDTLRYTDIGAATDPTRAPLPNGALGRWAVVAALPEPLEGPAVAIAPDPKDSSQAYLYVGGGRNGAGTVLDTIRVLPIKRLDDGDQTVGVWQPVSQKLSTARWQAGAMVADHTYNSIVKAGETWIYFGGGRAVSDTTGATDVGKVASGGGFSQFEGVDGSSARAGYGFAAASNYLYEFGGKRGAPSNDGSEAEIEGPPSVSNWNSQGGSGIATPRYLMGSAQESAVIFIAGGQTDVAAATATTECTNF